MSALVSALAAAAMLQAAGAFPPPGLPVPPPPPDVASLPSKLETANRRGDADAFVAAFAPDATVAVNAKVVAHGRGEIAGWVRRGMAEGLGYTVRTAAIGLRDIWEIEEVAVTRPGPGASGVLHGRVVHIVQSHGVISAMEIFDDGFATVYSPPPRF
jgi:hypothetical protein